MGRINVTIRIFEGTLVPNSRDCCRARFKSTVAPWREENTAQQAGEPTSKDTQCLQKQANYHNRALSVTVLAQDHCYSDLLRFVPTTNSLFRSAMTREHCPSA